MRKVYGVFTQCKRFFFFFEKNVVKIKYFPWFYATVFCAHLAIYISQVLHRIVFYGIGKSITINDGMQFQIGSPDLYNLNILPVNRYIRIIYYAPHNILYRYVKQFIFYTFLFTHNIYWHLINLLTCHVSYWSLI